MAGNVPLQSVQEAEEGLLALGVALVDAGVLQHLGKHQTGLLLDHVQGVIGGDLILALKALSPVSVRGGEGIGTQVLALGQLLGHGGQFRLQTGGQDSQTHDLDEANVLLLDVVQLRMDTRPGGAPR